MLDTPALLSAWHAHSADQRHWAWLESVLLELPSAVRPHCRLSPVQSPPQCLKALNRQPGVWRKGVMKDLFWWLCLEVKLKFRLVKLIEWARLRVIGRCCVPPASEF